MSTEILEVTDYWNRRKNTLDPQRAFLSAEDAIFYISESIPSLIPKKLSYFTDMIARLHTAIIEDYFKQIGTKNRGGTVVSVLPNGKLLVLTEKTALRKNRIYVRLGFEYDPEDDRAGDTKYITEYWRTDNEIRQESSFLQWKDAIAYIRRSADSMRGIPSVSDAVDVVMLDIINTCRAIEHDYFKLIGRNVKTNVRGEDASRGPLPTTGKIVAILPGGKGLAVSSEIASSDSGKNAKSPQRLGFLVGRTRLAQIIRDRKRK